MKRLFLAAVALALASLSLAQNKNVQKTTPAGNLTEGFNSAQTHTFLAGSTVTFSGALAGTPTGGTLNLSSVTLTLPATSGASLTSLNASNISSGTLAVAYGGTGTAYGPLSLRDVYNAADSALSYNSDSGGWTVAGASDLRQKLGALASSNATFPDPFTLYSAAAHTLTSAQVAFDNNAWATSRGAVQVHDGTESTYLIGVLASDTPSNGQFPRWNTGGTITWETVSGSGDALTSNPLSQFAATTSAQLAGVISDETGSGALVFGTSPTLTTPNLGTPSAATLTNATGLPIATGVAGLGTGVATALGVNTGSAGAVVLFNGALGTPSSGTLTNATGLPISTGVSGLGSGVGTFLATPSSANLASAVTDETGTGALVLANSPTLVTPTLGVATATSLSTTRQAHGNAGATETFDRANGDTHTATLDANLTVTLSGWSSSGTLSSMLIGLTQDGTGGWTVTWPAAVVTAPTVTTTAGAITWVNLWTTDGGTTIYASGTADGVPISSVSGLGTGVATALAVNVGSAGAPVVNGGALGTPSSGTLTNATGLPISTGVSGLGTGVATALAVNVGSAGAFVTNGGALGTPSSGTLTNATGLPISTGVSGLGTGVADLLATPSSANLRAALTDESGTGAALFAGGDIAAGTATTPAANDNDTSIATTAYVQTELTAYASDSATFTNKTLDASATGNVLKQYGYLILTHPTVFGSGVTQQTTVTSPLYGQALFSNSADKATNYVEYICVVPPDIDTSVDLTAEFKFILGGADTGDHEYEISMINVAASAVYDGAPGNAVSLTYTADSSGADKDVETAGAPDTLTGWAAAVTAGRYWRIRVARDGDNANDGSTVNSYSGPLVIRYGSTQ